MSSVSPSRGYVASVYFKRIVRWNRNSYPYISGDAFADSSDVSVYQPKFRGLQSSFKEIKNANVIFCPSSKLMEFLDNFHKSISAKVIIAGNDDTEFHQEFRNLPKSLRRMYLQNSFISDNERIFTLPIGIENFRYGVNGHPKLMQPESKTDPKNSALFGPFSATHKRRIDVRGLLINSDGPWTFLDNRVKPKELRQQMLEHSWVGAVRGNGVDTHRVWEALYRGRFPILELDVWSKSLSYLDLPIHLVEKYDPNTLKTLINEFKFASFNPKKLDSLWMPWWKKHINRACI